MLKRIWHALPNIQTLVTLLFAILFLLGFGFETPQTKFKAVNKRLDSLGQEITADRTRNLTTDRLVRAMARGECLDRTPRDLQLMDLPCDSLVPPTVRRH